MPLQTPTAFLGGCAILPLLNGQQKARKFPSLLTDNLPLNNHTIQHPPPKDKNITIFVFLLFCQQKKTNIKTDLVFRCGFKGWGLLLMFPFVDTPYGGLNQITYYILKVYQKF